MRMFDIIKKYSKLREPINWNEVDNYDFSDGTSGWTEIAGILSESNQILSIEGDGSNKDVRLRSDDNMGMLTTSDNIFYFFKARVTNTDCEDIKLQVDGSTGGTLVTLETILNPIQNQWYNIFEILLVSDQTGFADVRLQHGYSDTLIANGSVMEIEGNISNNGGVFALNLTKIDEVLGTSYATMTAEEVNAIKYQFLSF